MKIAWIVPRAGPCGISYYADQYAAALSKLVSLVECDPEEFVKDRKSLVDKISGCDLAHLQYDPSFFFKGGNDFFPSLCRSIRCKKIITVHEVYRIVPGVFPRENIRGAWPVKRAKQWLWDVRHPHWAAFNRNAAHNFFADAILVHAQFHRPILAARGVAESKITVVPLPVRSWSSGAAPQFSPGRPIALGATGFVNPLYDYDLLLSVLEKIAVPWRFIWVGGVRRQEDAALARSLQAKIDKRVWRDRFLVSGPVDDRERDRLFAEVQIACMFFKDRSSSASLAEAIAARRYIVATRIPLTEELVAEEPLAVLADADADAKAIAKKIMEVCSDDALRRSLERGCAAYGERFGFDACSRSVVAVYERLLSA
jgi:glycosyltransferase involved in cell wall biosynthesis